MSSGQTTEAQPQPYKRSHVNVFQRKTKSRTDSDVPQQERSQTGEGYDLEQNDGTAVRTDKRIQPDGESGRRGFNPLKFLKICWASSSKVSKWTNLLWPFTIAAIVLYWGPFHRPAEGHSNIRLMTFVTAYIGMVPAANLLGFAGQELARKIPKVIGVVLETTFGSLVEIILFMVLISGGNKNVPVIQAAILGSLLANLLLCLGKCSLQLTGTRVVTNHTHRHLLLRRRHLLAEPDLS